MITADVDIFLGLDVGKTEHWACAITKDGTKIWNKTLPNDEAKLLSVYQTLTAQGTVLIVVDQPATIGALAVAVAQHLDIPVAYLPGLSMRRIADMYPGTAKTDEKDAFIIAAATRQLTQTSKRIRGLFTQIHPLLGAGSRPLAGPRNRARSPRRLADPSRAETCRQSADRRETQEARSSPAHRVGFNHHY